MDKLKALWAKLQTLELNVSIKIYSILTKIESWLLPLAGVAVGYFGHEVIKDLFVALLDLIKGIVSLIHML